MASLRQFARLHRTLSQPKRRRFSLCVVWLPSNIGGPILSEKQGYWGVDQSRTKVYRFSVIRKMTSPSLRRKRPSAISTACRGRMAQRFVTMTRSPESFPAPWSDEGSATETSLTNAQARKFAGFAAIQENSVERFKERFFAAQIGRIRVERLPFCLHPNVVIVLQHLARHVTCDFHDGLVSSPALCPFRNQRTSGIMEPTGSTCLFLWTWDFSFIRFSQSTVHRNSVPCH